MEGERGRGSNASLPEEEEKERKLDASSANGIRRAGQNVNCPEEDKRNIVRGWSRPR